MDFGAIWRPQKEAKTSRTSIQKTFRKKDQTKFHFWRFGRPKKTKKWRPGGPRSQKRAGSAAGGGASWYLAGSGRIRQGVSHAGPPGSAPGAADPSAPSGASTAAPAYKGARHFVLSFDWWCLLVSAWRSFG